MVARPPITFVILLLLLTIVSSNTYGQDNPYTEMIRAIERWLESNPRLEFGSADQEQVFRWKVAIEQAGYRSEDRFLVYQEILTDIGERQFTYEHTIYNATSLRAFMLDTYP